jgi:hypothetical protein
MLLRMFFIIELLGTERLPIVNKQLMFDFDIGKHHFDFAIGQWACNIPFSLEFFLLVICCKFLRFLVHV